MARHVVGYESSLHARRTLFPRRARQWVLLIAIGVTGLALLVTLRSVDLNRDWGTFARIEVHVRDSATGLPVPGATLAVLDATGAPIPSNVSLATTTDAAGLATARVLVGASAADYVVAERVHFSTSRESVQVTAPGYAMSTVAIPRNGSTWRVPHGRVNALLRVQVDLIPPNAAATNPEGG